MGCNRPVEAYRVRFTTATDTWTEITFKKDPKADVCETLQLPCGKCYGCKLEKAREWTTRIMHEVKMHDRNCFLTLTYNDEHLPDGLEPDHFKRFIKKLRKLCYPQKVSYFMCGEYGNLGRPHYHACIFGMDFQDKIAWKKSGDNTLYRSPTLERLWSNKKKEPLGFCTVGDLDYGSAAYVAGYVQKKQVGRSKEIDCVDPSTGEIYKVHKEFQRMSLKPAIGKRFYQKWFSDLFPRDTCEVNGNVSKVPRYYTKLLKAEKPEMFEDLTFNRLKKKILHDPERLDAREYRLEKKARNKCRSV